LYGKEGEGETVQQIGRGEGGGGKATQGERGSRRRRQQKTRDSYE